MTTQHTFFNIGQGQGSVATDIDANQSMIVDCARGTDAAMAAQTHADDHSVVLILVTHLDWDHCADLMALVRRYQPKMVRLNNDTAWKSDEYARQLSALLRGLRDWDDGFRPSRWGGATTETPQNQPVVGGLRWRVLAPEPRDVATAHLASDRNAASVVLRLVSRSTVILYCGDAPGSVMTRLATEEAAALKSDVVVVTHHGGRWRSSRDIEGSQLYDLVDASIGIVSAGARNTYGHPFPEHLRDVGRGELRIMCTQVTPRCFGADHLEEHREAVAADNHHTPPQDADCAGEVCITVPDSGSFVVSPDEAQHGSRIALWPRPCCRAATGNPEE